MNKDKKTLMLIALASFVGVVILVLLLGLIHFDTPEGLAAGTGAIAAAIAASDIRKKQTAEAKLATAEAEEAAKASKEKLERLSGTYEEKKAETVKKIDSLTLEEKVDLANKGKT